MVELRNGGIMVSSLRDFIKEIEGNEDVLIIDDEVDWDLEATSYLWRLEERNEYPVVIFKKIRNLKGKISRHPLVVNIFATRERCARIFNTTIEDVAKKYAQLENNPKKPVFVEPKNAPVKEIVVKGKKVDLRDFPILKHHEKDAGPYITAGVHIVKHPEYGYNAAILRNQYKGPNKLGLFLVPGRHTDIYFRDYERRGSDMPVAIVIGHHPRFYFGAQTIQEISVDEYEIIGGVMESSLRLTSSETLGKDFLIPADAEIVLEGRILAGVREEEGEFGEYPKYYGPKVQDGYVIEITAINMRRDAYYMDVFPGHNDHLILGGIPVEGRIFDAVKMIVPGVKNVHLPVSGCCRFHCYVQIKKTNDSDGRNAILAALSAYPVIKHVIVVDEDIDIFNDSQVMWAIATRVQLAKDTIIIPRCPKAGLDPTSENNSSDRGGIDATQPLGSNMETLKKPE